MKKLFKIVINVSVFSYYREKNIIYVKLNLNDNHKLNNFMKTNLNVTLYRVMQTDFNLNIIRYKER